MSDQLRLGEEPHPCDGSGSCRALVHVHGCYADKGNCDQPQEHMSEVEVLRERVAFLEAELKRCQEQPRRTSKLDEHDENALGGFRAGDHPTSRKAAVFNYPRSGNQRHKILMELIQRPGGLITDELLELTRIPYVSASARVTELCDGGWIENSGRTRHTRLGADAIVWVATEKALIETDNRNGEGS